MIRTELVKSVNEEIPSPIAFFFIKIIEEGQWPSALKVGIIKPLFENGDRQIITKYRPISLITNFAKVFEKLLKTRILSYLNKHGVLSDNQFGVREKLSTQDAVYLLTSRLYQNLDKGLHSMCVFLDIAKTFDTVNHSQLMRVLENMGFRGTSYKLMNSYLEDRKQYVSINDIISSEKKIVYGVPQGTVLGPILFIMYMNAILNCTSAGIISSFADDTVILYIGRDWNELKEKAGDMKEIIECFNERYLTINYKKTYFITFSCYSDTLPSYDSLQIINNQEKLTILSKDSYQMLHTYLRKLENLQKRFLKIILYRL